MCLISALRTDPSRARTAPAHHESCKNCLSLEMQIGPERYTGPATGGKTKRLSGGIAAGLLRWHGQVKLATALVQFLTQLPIDQ